MPALNWTIFENLPGSANANFEMLCRSIVRRHYGQFGKFRALANQPGVEFHLKLTSACDLGAPPRWFGWQCKWYDLKNGEDLGAARRQQIKEGIEKTERLLPNVTDWILWTRHVLTKRDQEWFYQLPAKVKLELWSAAEVEDRLSGPTAILRETYFGELILTPEILADLHERAVAPIRSRWLPEVHQTVEAERSIHKTLGEHEAWGLIREIKDQLAEDIIGVEASVEGLPTAQQEATREAIEQARIACTALSHSDDLLERGQYDVLIDELMLNVRPTQGHQHLLRQLRSMRHPISLHTTNMLADMQRAQNVLLTLRDALERSLVAVVADAGCGKTQMSAQLTAATERRSAGLLLRGRALSSGQTLNDLARNISVRGKPVESFEALVAAVDAAGQRQGRRLPIVIDGLNEAEDPRDWKDQLASLMVIVEDYANVQVISTLRSAFTEDALPEDVARLEISGFDEDRVKAVRRYFRYYKIDAADAELPWDLLDHPLTLRIFCDVTNPDRKEPVGVGAIPGSLTTLFDRYLDQVAKRIAELAPARQRIFQADVHSALSKIGLALWSLHSRSIDLTELRRLLNDEGVAWNQSIVAALEHDGILFREPSDTSSQGRMSILYDALAGHVVAASLLGEHSDRFDSWIQDEKTSKALSTHRAQANSLIDSILRKAIDGLPDDWKQRAWSFRNRFRRPAPRDQHPLAYDIFRALVGLAPYKLNRRQLWPMLQGELRTDAIIEAAYMDSGLLDQNTVSEIATLVRVPLGHHRDLFKRLFVTRAAVAHPLNADFLDQVLREMPLPDRDLRWSEWIRREPDYMRDLQRLAERWKQQAPKARADELRARWVMWVLTSTNRALRDHATHALYQYGCNDPESLFSLTLDSLAVNDPYVPERMLAACYGVSMSLWADPQGTILRENLPRFANSIIERMFVPGAPHSTFHALTRDYALGAIALAKKIDPSCISTERLAWIAPPFNHLPSPFPSASTITDDQVAGAEDAIGMDFGNYTLGRLIKNRSNYDFDNADYKDTRRQIEYRMIKLGYSPKRFRATDNAISSDRMYQSRQDDGNKTDRYGKKYAWIAFFEMYGVKSDRDELSEWREVRPSDVDIDPSFPEPPKHFHPTLGDIFSAAPSDPKAWLMEGPKPDYSELLQLEEIDGNRGPWVLVQGYIEQSAPSDGRRVFSFLRGILVRRDKTGELLNEFSSLEYPGNSAIPEPMQDHYTFAGEIPWSAQFGPSLRDSVGKAKRDERGALSYFDGKQWREDVLVEIPAYRFSWESYHSVLNQVSGIDVVAPALGEELNLSNRRGEWDFYDPSGLIATVFREFKDSEDTFRSHVLFVRADLLKRYLSNERDLVWFVWGERNLHYGDMMNMRGELQDAYSGHRHIHKFSKVWQRD